MFHRLFPPMARILPTRPTAIGHLLRVALPLTLLLVVWPLAAESLPTTGPPITGPASSEDYARLLRQRYSQRTIPIPAEGVVVRSDVATFTLISGSVRLLEPLASGRTTGVLFEGEGLFELTIPDSIEREQLGRKSGRNFADHFEEKFTQMVLRTSEGFLDELFSPAPEGGYAESQVAVDRHENWLAYRVVDADARIVYGSLLPDDEYLRAAIKSETFGWLTYEFDGSLVEEVELSFFDPKASYLESWLRLDRAEDRDSRGRSTYRRQPAIDVEHVDIQADLTKAGSGSRVGVNKIQPRRGRFVVAMTFVSKLEGAAAVQLELDVLCKVTAVRNEEGQELTFLRDHLGKRRSVVDNDIYNNSLVVLLASPLAQDERRRLVVEYERDVLNYLPGRNWYPGSPEGFYDLHTARIEVRALKKHDLRSMGRKVEEGLEDGVQRVVWEIENPVKMATFSFAERFHEETIEQAGVPAVIAFATTGGKTVKNKAFNVAADLSNSINYFQQLFASPLPVERLYATSIIGGHGQSFDGFIHLAESTFELESSGPSELFRAHEAAHQWWGHEVGWASYRDQWLSEAFAEFSAILFIQASMEKGDEYYAEILRAYSEQTLGTMKKLSRFGRGWSMTGNAGHRWRLGPISTGYRAGSAHSPGGYFAQTYVKGAVVMHMLRVLLRNLTQSDEALIEVLRDLVRGHRGGVISTDDFVAALTRRVPADWNWFFEQWVHSAFLPTYTWKYTVGPSPDGTAKLALNLTVEQSGVPAGFRMPVPVEIDFGKGKTAQIVIMVDQAKESFSFPLSSKPKGVELNPGNAVLANVRQEKK